MQSRDTSIKASHREQEKRQFLAIFSAALVVLNALMIFAGTWSLAVPSGTAFDAFLDVMLAITIIANIFIVILGHVFLDFKNNKQAARINWYFSGYLIGSCFMILASIFKLLATALVIDPSSPLHGITLATSIAANALTHLLQFLACLGIFKIARTTRLNEAPGADHPWNFSRPVVDDASWTFKPSLAKVVKVIGVAFIFLVFGLAIYLPSLFLGQGPGVPYWVAGDLSMAAVLFLVPMTIIMVRHVPRTRSRHDRILLATFVIAGCVLVGINLVPIVQTATTTVPSLDRQFDAAFGQNWESKIPEQVRDRFQAEPLSLKAMVYAMPLPQVDENRDIPYMTDKGQVLKFDWYGPAGVSTTTARLPLIVALHPGSWRYFDKGVTGMFPASEILADQGYIVVDVQYGLYNDTAPKFTLRDMIHEIGNLTWFLALHADIYHVNMSRTFFLGRSAGAHLALVAGLGYNSSFFSSNFSTSLTCRGIIPFYAPTNLTYAYSEGQQFFGVPSNDFHYFSPVDIVTSTSPPVLCFQGLADGLVNPQDAYQLHDVMVGQGRICILGMFPNAGHAYDIFHNYFYDQVCLYYIERFLAILNN